MYLECSFQTGANARRKQRDLYRVPLDADGAVCCAEGNRTRREPASLVEPAPTALKKRKS